MRSTVIGVYIMTNHSKTLYTGMSVNLQQRIEQHKQKLVAGFTQKYNCTQCVYYEVCESTWQAQIREKQIKNLSRSEKIDLIEASNKKWLDLSAEFS